MSTKQHKKIDSFFAILAIVFIALAVVVIVTFKGIFSAVIVAYETDSSKGNDLRINKNQLDEAFKKTFEKEHIKLKLE
jgi:hypothetical protein